MSKKRLRDNEDNKKSKKSKPWFTHGNWVGPGWSNGKAQDSVEDYGPAVDHFDATARTHDNYYAWINKNVKDPQQKSKALENADKQFVLENDDFGIADLFKDPITSLKKDLARSGVNMQRIYRDITNKDPEKEADVPKFVTPPKNKINDRGISISPDDIFKTKKKLTYNRKSFINLP